MTDITWVLESEVFPDTHHELRAAIVGAGHNLIDWDDAWWTHGIPSIIPNTVTFFHGSLGNAAKVHNELNWTPGSFCDARVFQCSKWYSDAKEWLLHPDWRILSADSFVKDARLVADEVGSGTEVFVRPDSPLKPFSGRVLKVAEISLAKLDYGFYFDDETLPVVVCPVQAVEHEWRFVVVRSKVVTGSGYDASTRSPVPNSPNSDAWNFAQTVADSIPAPSDVYVLDTCECQGELKLLELNPFGGADLYACDAEIIVNAMSETFAN